MHKSFCVMAIAMCLGQWGIRSAPWLVRKKDKVVTTSFDDSCESTELYSIFNFSCVCTKRCRVAPSSDYIDSAR